MPQLAHTGWKVTGIDPNAYVADANGDPMYGARIHFVTGAGNKASVFVRDQELTPANAGALIDMKAALLDEIASLEAAPLGEVP